MTTTARTNSGQQPAPLDAVRVIGLFSVAMRPYATQILDNLGADVIKAEPQQGDLARLAPPMRNPGMGVLALDVAELGYPAAQIEQSHDGGSVVERPGR